MHSPVKCNLLSQSLFADEAIENIIADIGDGALHPFDRDRALCRVEVVLEEFIRGRRSLPVKCIGDLAPESGRVVHGSRVHFSVLVHAANVCNLLNAFRWRKYDIISLRRHGLGLVIASRVRSIHEIFDHTIERASSKRGGPWACTEPL